jgi:hypothetical protein
MTQPAYEETLKRFELEWLRQNLDLRLTERGDIALTGDGDPALGDRKSNALFRLVQRWRQSKSTLDDLFAPMARAHRMLDELTTDRNAGRGPALWEAPAAYHEVTDQILEYESISSILAGAVFVVLNNLLQRFRLDLGASLADWAAAAPVFHGHSLGEVVAAAAANFRHHDEWASTEAPTNTQKASMAVLAHLLDQPVLTERGCPTIRSNVCGPVLWKISGGSEDRLDEAIFAYAKPLARSA